MKTLIVRAKLILKFCRNRSDDDGKIFPWREVIGTRKEMCLFLTPGDVVLSHKESGEASPPM